MTKIPSHTALHSNQEQKKCAKKYFLLKNANLNLRTVAILFVYGMPECKYEIQM
jgi:hypothetical protein